MTPITVLKESHSFLGEAKADISVKGWDCCSEEQGFQESEGDSNSPLLNPLNSWATMCPHNS
jgi:hypothetical protein